MICSTTWANIALPVNMLPKAAQVEDFRLALETALKRTRNGPTGVLSARQIWLEFVADSGMHTRVEGLEPTAISRYAALAWEQSLDADGNTLNRALLNNLK